MTDVPSPPGVLIERVDVTLSGTRILHGVDIFAEPGEITGIIGPNGSGKSTLLRTVYRHLKPSSGRIVIGGDDIARLSPVETARLVAAVPQERTGDFDVTVREIVALGRIPHQGALARETAEDRRLIEDALREVGLLGHAHRTFSSLSGGERQRVLLARSFAQGGRVLVLDEPTNHLDVNHQTQLLGMLRGRGLTTLVTLHDLNAAASVCDRIHVLDDGRLVASGTPREVLTEDLLREVFGVRAAIIDHPLTADILIAFDHRDAP